MKNLNFSNIKKNFFTITLPDEKKTTLCIATPTKAILDNLNEFVDSQDGSKMDQEILTDLYELCARIMSRNKAGLRIDREYLEDLLDVEDILVFISSYATFIQEVGLSKN